MADQKINIGFLAGNEHDRALTLDPTVKIHTLGNNDANVLLTLIGDPDITWTRIHLTPSYFRKGTRFDLTPIDVLWNMISDADQHPGLLEVADRFVARFPGAVIDSPAQVKRTRRHHIADRLQGLPGVHMPRTLLLRNPTRDRVGRQVEASDFRFPAILREAGAHNGAVLRLAEGVDDCAPVFGDRRREFYLTEFVDVRAADGLYRKSRFFVVGEEVIVRQHLVAQAWNIHGASSRDYMVHHPHLLREASELLQGQFEALPELTRTALHAIRDAMGMDYFGIDACIMPDGSLTVFEANATMNFNPAFRNPATQYNRAAVPPMVAATRRLLVRRASERLRPTVG